MQGNNNNVKELSNLHSFNKFCPPRINKDNLDLLELQRNYNG